MEVRNIVGTRGTVVMERDEKRGHWEKDGKMEKKKGAERKHKVD